MRGAAPSLATGGTPAGDPAPAQAPATPAAPGNAPAASADGSPLDADTPEARSASPRPSAPVAPADEADVPVRPDARSDGARPQTERPAATPAPAGAAERTTTPLSGPGHSAAPATAAESARASSGTTAPDTGTAAAPGATEPPAADRAGDKASDARPEPRAAAAAAKDPSGSAQEQARNQRTEDGRSGASGAPTAPAGRALAETARPVTPTPTGGIVDGTRPAPTPAPAAPVAAAASSRPAELLLKAAAGLETQLARKAREFLQKGFTQIRVTLDPPQLGRLRVDLDLSEARVTARIVASSPEAAALLMRDREELIRAFQHQGIDDVRVEVQTDADRGTAQGRDREDGRRHGTRNVPAPGNPDMPERGRAERPRTPRGIDLVA